MKTLNETASQLRAELRADKDVHQRACDELSAEIADLRRRLSAADATISTLQHQLQQTGTTTVTSDESKLQQGRSAAEMVSRQLMSQYSIPMIMRDRKSVV